MTFDNRITTADELVTALKAELPNITDVYVQAGSTTATGTFRRVYINNDFAFMVYTHVSDSRLNCVSTPIGGGLRAKPETDLKPDEPWDFSGFIKLIAYQNEFKERYCV